VSEPSAAPSRLERLWGIVAPMLPTHDVAHDRDHVLRVVAWTARLAVEIGADVELAQAAGMVHDLVNIPKDHPDRPLGGERSAEAAGGLLEAAGFDPSETAAVVEAVRTCSWSRRLAPTGPLGRALQQADRLDAIGALGVARCFATCQAMAVGDRGSRFYDPSDPLGESGRPLDDVRNAADHFRRKLLLLADGMDIPLAQAEATERHATMLMFLSALEREAQSAR
jgi:uncharacterized protein